MLHLVPESATPGAQICDMLDNEIMHEKYVLTTMEPI